MVIKHIVISGGGPTGFLTYGAARYLAKEDFWKLSDIKSIYGCSIGAYMGVILSLGYDWDWLDDYFIKRPWNKVIGITPTNILESFMKKGILGEKFMIDSLEPLFSANDIDINISLKEFHELNGIDIHLYSANINTYNIEKVDISHSTHPDISVIKALCMSTAFPVAFEPVIDDKGCYIDGGLLNNYPLNDCIEQTKCERDEILAFKNIWVDKNTTITHESSMLDFLNIMIRKIQRFMGTDDKQTEVKYTVRCLVENLNGFNSWINALSTEEMRNELIDKGSHHAKLFLDYISLQ